MGEMKTEISINGGAYNDLEKVREKLRQLDEEAHYRSVDRSVADTLVERFGLDRHVPTKTALRRILPLAQELAFIVQAHGGPAEGAGERVDLQLENLQLKNSLRGIWLAVQRLTNTTDSDDYLREMTVIHEVFASLPEGVILT